MGKWILPVLALILSLLLGCMPVMPAEALRENRSVLILMYHGVLRDPGRSGKYVVSPAELERDLVYLQQAGYECVLPRELIAFVRGTGELPEKPVVLTFDDGYENNLTYVLPLLQQYDMRAALGVVGAYATRYTETPDPNPNYAYLSWDALYALRLSDRVELTNHSYDMHAANGRRGSTRMAGESEQDYARAFLADAQHTQDLLRQKTGAEARVYVYPFGAVEPGSQELLASLGFEASMGCEAKRNLITRGEPDCLWNLCRYNRPGDVTSADFFAGIEG